MLPDKIYNYYALTAAIFNQRLSVEDAISKFSPPTQKHRGRPKAFDIAIVEEMVHMKQHMTHKQIGQFFGISDQAVCVRIHRYKKGSR